MRKKASLLLAAAVMTASITGCAKDTPSEGAKQAAETAGKKEPVTLKVEVFDRGNSPTGVTVTDNPWTKWVQDKFGSPSNIKMEYIPVPRSQEVDKLNIMMASGDAPDIVFTYDIKTVQKYADQGGLAELDDTLKEHGANLTGFLGKDTLSYGLYKNKQYAIPAKRVFQGRYSSFIRQDWLDKLGLPAPKTTEELYTTLKAFKEKDPGNTGGKTIPMGMALSAASYDLLVWSGVKGATEEEKATLTQQLSGREFPLLLPGHKDAVRFMNKLYNEGLVSPDFALDKDKKKLQQDIMTGKVGFYTEDVGSSFGDTPGIYKTLQKNTPGAKLLPIDTISNAEGKYAKALYRPAGMFIMIPKSSKHQAEAIKYLNWMSQKDNLFTLMNGFEGKNYTLENGLPVGIDSEETKNLMYNSSDMAIISNGRDFQNTDKNMEAMAIATPKEYRSDYTQSLKISMTDGFNEIRFNTPIDSEAKYGKTLQEKYETLLVKCMLVKPDEFDKTYDAMLKDYMSSGGQEIVDERKAAYAAEKKGK